jgi:hypothetical protein
MLATGNKLMKPSKNDVTSGFWPLFSARSRMDVRSAELMHTIWQETPTNHSCGAPLPCKRKA